MTQNHNRMNWYELTNPQQIDSPALLVYPAHIERNIAIMLELVGGDPDRLMPHVKTYKMAEVVSRQVDAGITRFKCATIAEAEMLADTGALHVLLAYQLAGPKLQRYAELAAAFNWVEWASLVDNAASAEAMAEAVAKSGRKAVVYVDVNNGMNRTGFPLTDDLEGFYRSLLADERLDVRGFHVYDGHLRDPNFFARQEAVEAAIRPVLELADKLAEEGLTRPLIVAGGTPTFSVHARNPALVCSPGTCLLWDWGYDDLLAEQPFEWAALLMTRVISKPALGIVTTDLGHKAVAAENPLNRRIKFLNLDGYEVIGQSEEHLVLRVTHPEKVSIGDVLYGVPYHICPTVALHDTAQVVAEGELQEPWAVTARRRRITY